ncbi:MAG: glycosyltransferase family 2 protein [Bacteroidetes bacterium]|nr:glycosyltransferase family 2 protein [Bacteroidota bacterium]
MMSKPVFFSIVIPTYNRGDLILATLESVLAQSYREFEVIIVDNCSTDDTDRVLQPYIDKGLIRYIKHDKNYERAKSRNTGMQNAKGDFLTLLDSDDFMYRDCLQDASQYILRNPEIMVFQNMYELVNEQRERVYLYSFPSLENQYKALCGGNFMACIGGFLHKEVYTKIQFDANRELTGSEDYEFWFRVFAKYKVGRINKVNSGVLQHEGRSVNFDTFDLMVKHKEYIVAMIRRHSAVKEKFEKYIPRFEASFLIYAAIKANQARLFSKSIQLLHKALRADFTVLFSKRFIRVYQIALFKLKK